MLAELAFGDALAARDPGPLRDPHLLPADVAWRLPSLQARCAALLSALDGDAPPAPAGWSARGCARRTASIADSWMPRRAWLPRYDALPGPARCRRCR
ncbi:MAG: hypothetical protein BGP24_00085 [Lysobacterales bacterium 69-70]|nr:MAG: hypothetical protein ABS97_10760 [Xanthomonadaceae bacterium SCN 69-320]ODV21029.1 MAG: hypothetical protein ABT27_05710 [Xanthomonadaceae bacterium SCN 69-25]OJY99257.1 MAG: hypothetical protein BGP24_00085 [Xanthomonadales bacterium 69-70]